MKNNRTGNSLRSLKHVRAGASRTFWERIVGWFVSGSVGGFEVPTYV